VVPSGSDIQEPNPDHSGCVSDSNLMDVESDHDHLNAPRNTVDLDSVEINAVCYSDEELLTKSCALFFLKSEGLHNLPYFTVQKVVDEMKEINEQSKANLSKTLSRVLDENNVESNKASKIIQEVTKDNSYSFYQPLLSSVYMRKKYYREHFSCS